MRETPENSATPGDPQRWRKIALVVAALAAVLAGYHFGAFDAFADPVKLRDTLRREGPAGMAVYVLVVACVQPLGVPGTMFIVVASLVWGPAVAIPLSLFACTISSLIGFSFARYVARDWVERRIPTKWRKYDDRLEERGFVTVFALRTVFWMNPTLHALFGLSRVRFGTHLAASVLAYIAPVVVLALLGDAAFGFLRQQPIERWIAAAGLLAVGVALAWGVRWYRQRRVSVGS